jgi:hypothetical protein
MLIFRDGDAGFDRDSLEAPLQVTAQNFMYDKRQRLAFGLRQRFEFREFDIGHHGHHTVSANRLSRRWRSAHTPLLFWIDDV